MELSGFYGAVHRHYMTAAKPFTHIQLSCCMQLTMTMMKFAMLTVMTIRKRRGRVRRCIVSSPREVTVKRFLQFKHVFQNAMIKPSSSFSLLQLFSFIFYQSVVEILIKIYLCFWTDISNNALGQSHNCFDYLKDSENN